MVQAAKLAAARSIIAVDPIADTARARRQRSAPPTSSTPAPDDPVAQVQALTEGRGADYVLEAATLALGPDPGDPRCHAGPEPSC